MAIQSNTKYRYNFLERSRKGRIHRDLQGPHKKKKEFQLGLKVNRT